MICAYCGKAFDRNGTNRKYCTDECAAKYKKDYDKNRKQSTENRSRQNAIARQGENKLNQIMKECVEQGISYSEWKKAQTLAKVPRIEV